MDRSKQMERRGQPDGQITNVDNIQFVTRQLSPDYQIVACDGRRMNGLLRVFSLVPKTAGGVRFDGRLDDGNPGNRRRADLDVDICGAEPTIQKDFKSRTPRQGYSGHHANKSTDPYHHDYEVNIRGPGGVVFEGRVSFNVTFYVGITDQLHVTDELDATVTRGPRRADSS